MHPPPTQPPLVGRRVCVCICMHRHNIMHTAVLCTTTLSADMPKHLRIEHKHGIDWIGRRRGRRRHDRLHAHSEIGPKDYVVERGQRLNHRFYVKNGKYLFASLPCVCVSSTKQGLRRGRGRGRAGSGGNFVCLEMGRMGG